MAEGSGLIIGGA
jgi:hypothetical protein